MNKPTLQFISQMTNSLLLRLVVFLSLAYAILGQITPSTYIVQIQNDHKPSIFNNVDSWYNSMLLSLSSNTTSTLSNSNSLEFVHVYTTVFHGFSAKLTPDQVQELSRKKGVLSIIPDIVYQLQTTRSPEFLGLTTRNPSSLLNKSDGGSNVVIGLFDTGIFPESASFNDNGIGPVPSHWKGGCENGFNFCNKKLVGARAFYNGYTATFGDKNSDVKSPRDNQGHGTHTASTAGGNPVANTSFFGFAKGTVTGMAPKARIASYKVCWHRGCLSSDLLAGLDMAVRDGVNVMSISLGGTGSTPYFRDPIAIGTFGAINRGIFVSAAAGNSGPKISSVTNVAPWITTVGASTLDRSFPVDLVLGDGSIIAGTSIYTGKLPGSRSRNAFLPIIYAGNASIIPGASFCVNGSLDEKLVKGKIVVCRRGNSGRVAKGEVVKKAGGVGMVLENTVEEGGEGLVADAHLLPAISITASAGIKLLNYVKSGRNPNPKGYMKFRPTEVGVKPAPVIASFSSRGPNTESIYVLKPDVLAPGVNILASWPENVSPTGLPSDNRRSGYNIISGTSMSCPHVSGLGALLKGAHPDWSPAMIRSALMTTAYTQYSNNQKYLLDAQLNTTANIWTTGSGHVDPEKAADPGLVYDLTVNDYSTFMCASGYSDDMIQVVNRDTSFTCGENKVKPWDLNYPAIMVSLKRSGGVVVAKRTVTHVSDGPGIYRVIVSAPKGTRVVVVPRVLRFSKKGQKLSYSVRVVPQARGAVSKSSTDFDSGKLTWYDGKRQVTSPIVVTWADDM